MKYRDNLSIYAYYCDGLQLDLVTMPSSHLNHQVR